MTDQGGQGDRGLEGQRGERGDAGHQGDDGRIGETGLQGDRGLEGQRGQRGDTGSRGLVGPKGERGADSDSVEVLTEVLDKLTTELVGLRGDVRTERRGRRLSLAVIAVALTIAAVVAGIGYANYRGLADRQAADRQAQALEIRVNKYDQEAGLNAVCEASNDNRASRRQLFLNLYDLVETAPPPTPRTPEEQKSLDDFLTAARADVITETVPADCEAVAPRPEGERPS